MCRSGRESVYKRLLLFLYYATVLLHSMSSCSLVSLILLPS
jgi:hypothetical protein